MRIGLFGGSFNPVHKGHEFIAKYSIDKLDLDFFIFIPCYRSVDKSSDIYCSAKHRLNMLKLILFDRCSISEYELDRKTAIESIETIRHFRELYKHDELFFIIGEDNWLTIDTWQDYEQIGELVNLVVFRREVKFKKKRNLKTIFMNNDLCQASSSDVRNTKITSFLNPKVLKYIKENNLYGFFD